LVIDIRRVLRRRPDWAVSNFLNYQERIDEEGCGAVFAAARLERETK
jgi:hypothetical protein